MSHSNLLELLQRKQKTIAVLGLGYVGLPLAITFARKYNVIGYDIDAQRIHELSEKVDRDGEIESEAFLNRSILFTADAEKLRSAHVYIICVPTDIDRQRSPNLEPLMEASKAVAKYLNQYDYVIYESTVYPGCTEEVCLPILEEVSGLLVNKDFKLGYSPERMVPGSNQRSLEQIVKIVSGSDAEALETVAGIYQSILNVEVYRAESIKVAEAAKVVENTQRYINISLMNELSILFKKMNIDTNQVISAAKTKWNFHSYSPGLVGGHCISVDPFYLLHKAVEVGYHSQIIAAGSRINDSLPSFIAKSLVQKLLSIDKQPNKSKVLVMGVTFKENIKDIRNSKVFDLIQELKGYYIQVDAYDPGADSLKVQRDYQIELVEKLAVDYDAIIVAVPHQEFLSLEESFFISRMKEDNPILFDLKGIYKVSEKIMYWSL